MPCETWSLYVPVVRPLTSHLDRLIGGLHKRKLRMRILICFQYLVQVRGACSVLASRLFVTLLELSPSLVAMPSFGMWMGTCAPEIGVRILSVLIQFARRSWTLKCISKIMLPLFITSGCECSYYFTMYAQSVYAKIVKLIFARNSLFPLPFAKLFSINHATIIHNIRLWV